MESSINETKSQESYIFNQDTVTRLKKIKKKKVIRFDKSWKTL